MEPQARLSTVSASSRRFIDVAKAYSQVTVMTHDNPDPDAIASGWAILHLLEKTLQRPVSLIGGGEIVRAENREMVSLLSPPLRLNQEVPLHRDSLLVLVDCDVDSTNHLAIDSAKGPVAVIDHHCREKGDELPTVYEDRRPDAVATSTIAASYLREQGIVPTVSLATALVYGIRTETKAGQTAYSGLDREILTWLVGLSNPSLLARIEDAPLSQQYYSDLALALQNTEIYGQSAFCILPQIEGPEVVGEFADLLARGRSIRNAFCGALYRGNFVVSVRTADEQNNAAKLVVRILRDFGHGGGHPHRAGGIVFNVKPAEADKLFSALRARWIEDCESPTVTGQRLVCQEKILSHLRATEPR